MNPLRIYGFLNRALEPILATAIYPASHDDSSVNSFLPMLIRGELSFRQGFPC